MSDEPNGHLGATWIAKCMAARPDGCRFAPVGAMEGMALRPVVETVADTLAWVRERGEAPPRPEGRSAAAARGTAMQAFGK